MPFMQVAGGLRVTRSEAKGSLPLLALPHPFLRH
jgi:hypothetical protein